MNRAALAGCCLLAAGIQARAIALSPTPSADTIRYLRVARDFAAGGWTAGVRGNDEHPLYPAVVAVAHSWVTGWTPPRMSWVLAAQAASAAFAVATLPLAWLAFRQLVGESAALAGVALLAIWPALGASGADALADSLQLALLSAAWVAYLRGTRIGLVMAGFLLGVAALARAEAWLVAAAFLAASTIIAAQGSRGWLARFRDFWPLAGGLCVAPALLLATARPHDAADAAARLLGRPRSGVSHFAESTPAPGFAIPIKARVVSSRFEGIGPAASAFARGTLNLGGWLWGFLAVAALAAWRNAPRVAEQSLSQRKRTLLAAAFYAVAVVLAASRLGYVSQRQAMPLLLLLMPWAGEGALAAWALLRAGLARGVASIAGASSGDRSESWAANWLARAMAGGALAAAAVNAGQAVHTSRLEHRLAAEWLAQQGEPGAVLDTRGWTALYSGRDTYPVDRSAEALRDPRLKYLVFEARELGDDNRRCESLRALVRQAEPAPFGVTDPRADGRNAVLIYRWRPERMARRDLPQLSRAE